MDRFISAHADTAYWVAPLLEERAHYTLLAVCPTSDAVLRASIEAAAQTQAPLLIAATRNQVDLDGGYTGWTPRQLTARVEALRKEVDPAPPVVCCVDHGGPWCKDREREAGASWEEAQAATQDTIKAALDAGYRYVHIDTTLDPHRAGPPPVDVMVERAVALLEWTETYRRAQGYPEVTYEMGIEEVAPGPLDAHHERLEQFLTQLHAALPAAHHPTFAVSDVGTSFGTGQFDVDHAARVVEQVRSYGALVKAHYSDFVSTLDAYPRCGVGGANIGPGLSAVEYDALCDLERLAVGIGASPTWHRALRKSLIDSERWRKWVPNGDDTSFHALSTDAQEKLLATGSRYVWADPAVEEARTRLYQQVAAYRDADAYVQWRLRSAVLEMLHTFNLVGRAAA